MRYKGRTALLVAFCLFAVYGLFRVETGSFSPEYHMWPLYRQWALHVMRYLLLTVLILSLMGISMVQTREPIENVLSHGTPYQRRGRDG